MKTLILSAITFVSTLSTAAISFEQHKAKPKLVVMIVVDQFRADTFTRLEKKFLPAGTEKKPGGFQFLLSKGAYFPLAEYKIMAAMTCPGHAMISTGGYPANIGIPINGWYDRVQKRRVGCVEDNKDGVSPRNLTTSTIGDELKTISKKSKVIAMAVKDRSAVMLGGHQADYAFWYGNNGWQTSTYYAPQIPKWVEEVNASNLKSPARTKIEVTKLMKGPTGIEWTSQLALKALDAENLGKDEATDILALSFSSHDIAGHAYGPFSPEVEAVAISEDKEISKLLSAISLKLGSLKDVVVVLTGDHGIPPTVEQLQVTKQSSGKIDDLEFYKKLATRLNKKFGKPSSAWISAGTSMNYYINPDALVDRKASIEAVEQEIKAEAKTLAGVAEVFTATEFEKGIQIHPVFKTQITNQFIRKLSGDVVIIPEPFYMDKDENLVTHTTGYSYDRYVPLVIYGGRTKAGVYAESAEIIDIAPTLSFILGQVPPAKSSGRVLSEIF